MTAGARRSPSFASTRRGLRLADHPATTPRIPPLPRGRPGTRGDGAAQLRLLAIVALIALAWALVLVAEVLRSCQRGIKLNASFRCSLNSFLRRGGLTTPRWSRSPRSVPGASQETRSNVVHNLDDSGGIVTAALEVGRYYNGVSHTDLVHRVLKHFTADADSIPSHPVIAVDEYQEFSRLWKP